MNQPRAIVDKKFFGKPRRPVLLFFVFLFVAIIFFIIPFITITVERYGPFFTHDNVWQGFLVIVFVYGSCFALACLFPRLRIVLFLFSTTLYLNLNHVAIPFVTDLAYLEILHFIGGAFFKTKGKSPGTLANFIAGTAIYGSGAILLSLAGYGTIITLQWMTVALFLVSLVVSRKDRPSTLMELTVSFLKGITKKGTMLLAWLCLIFVAVSFARTNHLGDIDSAWYLLHPEYQLIGSQSFYDYLGYSAFVFYYPKLMEVLYLPISGLGDNSFIMGMNVLVSGLIGYCAYKGARLADLSQKVALVCVLTVFAIPSVQGIATTAKTDILGTLFVVAAFVLFLQFIEEKAWELFLFSLCSLLMCTGTKSTCLLWGTMLFFVEVGYAFVYWFKRTKGQRLFFTPKWAVFGVVAAAFVFVLGIHWRTFALTGFPYYPYGSEELSALGFAATPHFSAKSTNYMFSAVGWLESFLGYFFAPEVIHTYMCWSTNIMLLAPISVLLLALALPYAFLRTVKKRVYAFCLGTGVVQCGLGIYFSGAMAKIDGNYFLIPSILVLFCLVVLFHGTLHNADMEHNAYYRHFSSKLLWGMSGVACALFICLHMPLGFVSGWSWHIGTEGFQREIFSDNFDTKKLEKDCLIQYGAVEVAKYIEERYPNTRTIVPFELSFINGRIETVWSAFEPLWAVGKPPLESFENFVDYLDYADIQCLVVPKESADTLSVYCDFAEQYVQSFGYYQLVEDTNYLLYILY